MSNDESGHCEKQIEAEAREDARTMYIVVNFIIGHKTRSAAITSAIPCFIEMPICFFHSFALCQL